MSIFKSFSIRETQKEIESYIIDFDEFEPFIDVSYENYRNQIIINYNFTLRRIRNRISCLNFIKRYFLNKKLNNYYLGKMNNIKSKKILWYLDFYLKIICKYP
jgi:hypothetical protein